MSFVLTDKAEKDGIGRKGAILNVSKPLPDGRIQPLEYYISHEYAVEVAVAATTTAKVLGPSHDASMKKAEEDA
jgi:hypothetical protein